MYWISFRGKLVALLCWAVLGLVWIGIYWFRKCFVVQLLVVADMSMGLIICAMRSSCDTHRIHCLFK